ncbi:CRISPR-associated protein Cas4 [Tepidiphilus olei]|uniref:CRISPR-associated protein Cas4 n=1 Tax=Tepidiphilus olei TaxID=2502184 RepID=UPI00115C6FE0|nr:CRISPR-associated protein Cas4 [Tepidiphilus olei]
MSDDDEPLALSALQHWVYCPRQCALIHLEQRFEENVHTARGRAAHALVDLPGAVSRQGVRSERALPLWSERLGLVGKADLVEFHPDGQVFPVEFKYGRKRGRLADEVQLAAQAMCLEEMLNVSVPRGAIYHVSSHRRREVPIDETLRRRVEETVAAVRQMLASRTLPPPLFDARCKECSLRELCQPELGADRGLFHRTRSVLFQPEEE